MYHQSFSKDVFMFVLKLYKDETLISEITPKSSEETREQFATIVRGFLKGCKKGYRIEIQQNFEWNTRCLQNLIRSYTAAKTKTKFPLNGSFFTGLIANIGFTESIIQEVESSGE
jgi:hypothetical protein